MDYKPTRPAGRQAGGSFPDIEKAANPYDFRDANFQAETNSPKSYLVKNEKMPSIELVQNRENQATIRMVPTISKASFRGEPMVQSFPTEGNMRMQFVSENEFDSPASFGHA